jgi:hypothetical protein
MDEAAIRRFGAAGERRAFANGRFEPVRIGGMTLGRAAAATAALALLAVPHAAFGWGDNGHRIVAQVAENRLSAPARDRVRALLGARRLAQIAAWPDFIRSEKNWEFLDTWHYATIEDGQRLAEVLDAAAATPEPDNVVEAIGFFAGILGGDGEKARLFRERMAKEEVEPLEGSLELTALAFLVHFVGDVHQPLHVGRGGDRGANQIKVNWFGELSNLHAVWDSGLVASEHLAFTEYADFLEREFQGAEGQFRGAAPAAWAAESIGHRGRVYDVWRKTSPANYLPDLGYDYAHAQIDLVNRRLFAGGVRLAELLDAVLGGAAPGGGD